MIKDIATGFFGLFLGFVLLGLIAILVINGLDELSKSQSNLVWNQGQSRALVIEANAEGRAKILQAQGQNRLDTALAINMFSAAALPWIVVFGIAGLVIWAMYRHGPPALPQRRQDAPKITEQYFYYLPPAQYLEALHRAAQQAQQAQQAQLKRGPYDQK